MDRGELLNDINTILNWMIRIGLANKADDDRLRLVELRFSEVRQKTNFVSVVGIFVDF